MVVNNSVALAIMALFAAAAVEAAEAAMAELVTTVRGCGLTSLSFRATHKSLEILRI